MITPKAHNGSSSRREAVAESAQKPSQSVELKMPSPTDTSSPHVDLRGALAASVVAPRDVISVRQEAVVFTCLLKLLEDRSGPEQWGSEQTETAITKLCTELYGADVAIAYAAQLESSRGATALIEIAKVLVSKGSDPFPALSAFSRLRPQLSTPECAEAFCQYAQLAGTLGKQREALVAIHAAEALIKNERSPYAALLQAGVAAAYESLGLRRDADLAIERGVAVLSWTDEEQQQAALAQMGTYLPARLLVAVAPLIQSHTRRIDAYCEGLERLRDQSLVDALRECLAEAPRSIKGIPESYLLAKLSAEYNLDKPFEDVPGVDTSESIELFRKLCDFDRAVAAGALHAELLLEESLKSALELSAIRRHYPLAELLPRASRTGRGDLCHQSLRHLSDPLCLSSASSTCLTIALNPNLPFPPSFKPELAQYLLDCHLLDRTVPADVAADAYSRTLDRYAAPFAQIARHAQRELLNTKRPDLRAGAARLEGVVRELLLDRDIAPTERYHVLLVGLRPQESSLRRNVILRESHKLLETIFAQISGGAQAGKVSETIKCFSMLMDELFREGEPKAGEITKRFVGALYSNQALLGKVKSLDEALRQHALDFVSRSARAGLFDAQLLNGVQGNGLSADVDIPLVGELIVRFGLDPTLRLATLVYSQRHAVEHYNLPISPEASVIDVVKTIEHGLQDPLLYFVHHAADAHYATAAMCSEDRFLGMLALAREFKLNQSVMRTFTEAVKNRGVSEERAAIITENLSRGRVPSERTSGEIAAHGGRETWIVEALDKREQLLRALRFADGYQCCFTSPSREATIEPTHEAWTIAALAADPLSIIMEIRQAKSGTVIGFIFGRSAINPADKTPVLMLNGLYVPDKSPEVAAQLLYFVETDIASPAGFSAVYLNATQGGVLNYTPAGYEDVEEQLVAIRPLGDGEESLIASVDDDIGRVANGDFLFSGFKRSLL